MNLNFTKMTHDLTSSPYAMFAMRTLGIVFKETLFQQ